MSPDQVIDLLSLMAAYDRRTVGETDVRAWHLAVADLPFDDAKEAVVRHYQQERSWLMPVDVRKLVKKIREERITADPLPAPDPELAVDPESYTLALRRIVRTAGDGRMPFRAIPGPRTSEPPAEYQALRSDEDRERVLVKSVPCPVEGCNARENEPCRVRATGQELAKWHPSRLEAAQRAQDGGVAS